MSCWLLLATSAVGAKVGGVMVMVAVVVVMVAVVVVVVAVRLAPGGQPLSIWSMFMCVVCFAVCFCLFLLLLPTMVVSWR